MGFQRNAPAVQVEGLRARMGCAAGEFLLRDRGIGMVVGQGQQHPVPCHKNNGRQKDRDSYSPSHAVTIIAAGRCDVNQKRGSIEFPPKDRFVKNRSEEGQPHGQSRHQETVRVDPGKGHSR